MSSHLMTVLVEPINRHIVAYICLLTGLFAAPVRPDHPPAPQPWSPNPGDQPRLQTPRPEDFAAEPDQRSSCSDLEGHTTRTR